MHYNSTMTDPQNLPVRSARLQIRPEDIEADQTTDSDHRRGHGARHCHEGQDQERSHCRVSQKRLQDQRKHHSVAHQISGQAIRHYALEDRSEFDRSACESYDGSHAPGHRDDGSGGEGVAWYCSTNVGGEALLRERGVLSYVSGRLLKTDDVSSYHHDKSQVSDA
jgi:hypothetical protein